MARRLDDKARIELEDLLDDIESRWIQVIDDYHFPVVTLSDKTEPDALCTIFETLNRTGVKLSVFELLTARFWPQNIKLRDLWDSARQTHPVIEEFEVDPYYILQAIALASRKAPSCKRSDVLNLGPDDINTWWHPVVNGLALGLEILRDDCKVMLPKWLPYQTHGCDGSGCARQGGQSENRRSRSTARKDQALVLVFRIRANLRKCRQQSDRQGRDRTAWLVCRRQGA